MFFNEAIAMICSLLFQKILLLSLSALSILVLVENVREIYVRVLTVLVVPLLEQSLAFLVRFVPVDVDVVSQRSFRFSFFSVYLCERRV